VALKAQACAVALVELEALPALTRGLFPVPFVKTTEQRIQESDGFFHVHLMLKELGRPFPPMEVFSVTFYSLMIRVL
jgi:hypothetical protein